MDNPSRVYLRTLSQEAYADEENFEVMKKLNSDDLHDLVQMVLEKVQKTLQSGINVVFEGFGVLQVRHPKVKTRRSFDIVRKKIVDHQLKSKVHFLAHFEAGRENNA